MSSDRLGCHSIQKCPPGPQWIRPHCPLHTPSSALYMLLGAPGHMPPPWVLAMFPLLEKGLPMEEWFWNKFPEAFAPPNPSLGPQVRYSWLMDQATQWEGLHSRFWFFIVSTASVICKDNAYSDICNHTMVTISIKSLHALEILCFIDSFFSFISWDSVGTHCTWPCSRDWEYCNDKTPSPWTYIPVRKWNTNKMNPYEKIVYYDQVGFIPGMQA